MKAVTLSASTIDYDGLGPFPKGGDHIEKHASAVATVLVAEHLAKCVMTGWKACVRSLAKNSDSSGFRFNNRGKQIVKKLIGHSIPLA